MKPTRQGSAETLLINDDMIEICRGGRHSVRAKASFSVRTWFECSEFGLNVLYSDTQIMLLFESVYNGCASTSYKSAWNTMNNVGGLQQENKIRTVLYIVL